MSFMNLKLKMFWDLIIDLKNSILEKQNFRTIHRRLKWRQLDPPLCNNKFSPVLDHITINPVDNTLLTITSCHCSSNSFLDTLCQGVRQIWVIIKVWTVTDADRASASQATSVSSVPEGLRSQSATLVKRPARNTKNMGFVQSAWNLLKSGILAEKNSRIPNISFISWINVAVVIIYRVSLKWPFDQSGEPFYPAFSATATAFRPASASITSLLVSKITLLRRSLFSEYQ